MTTATMVKDDIQVAFEKFNSENPVVLLELERLTREWLKAGHKRLGIGALWERLRWEMNLIVRDDSPFQLNNNYRSRYVRLMIARNPDWIKVFSLRQLTAS